MSERIAVLGATGAIGARLVSRLVAEGFGVVAVSRSGPPDLRPEVRVVAADVGDSDAIRNALAGCDAAYYLVHSMGNDEDFVETDARRAASFAAAAKDVGIGRVVYLGGLGSGELSVHLRSRQQVGALLAEQVPTVEVRAGVILGTGSISFEMLRYLSERLPIMITPRWLRTPIQPVGMNDMLQVLLDARTFEPGIVEVGSSHPVTYDELLQAYARVRGLRRRLIIPVPLLSLKLSSYWVDFVTPVDARISHALIDSLAIPVTVQGTRTIEFLRSIDDVLREVLDDQRAEVDASVGLGRRGAGDGMWFVRERRSIRPDQVAAARADLRAVGGNLSWYGITLGWRLRMWFGRLLGEQLTLVAPDRLEVGARVDWWTVVGLTDRQLAMRSEEWRVGEAWLSFEVLEDEIRCCAAFRPKGVLGFVYWKLLGPLHRAAFRGMVRRRVRRGRIER